MVCPNLVGCIILRPVREAVTYDGLWQNVGADVGIRPTQNSLPCVREARTSLNSLPLHKGAFFVCYQLSLAQGSRFYDVNCCLYKGAVLLFRHIVNAVPYNYARLILYKIEKHFSILRGETAKKLVVRYIGTTSKRSEF